MFSLQTLIQSYHKDFEQLATIPQLLPGTQFPYSFSGQPIPGYYIPQPIAQVTTMVIIMIMVMMMMVMVMIKTL